MAKKVKLLTSKGEAKALVHLISLYYGIKQQLEEQDICWVLVSASIFALFQKLITRLAKLEDEPSGKALTLTLKQHDAVALLKMLQQIDSLGFYFDFYTANVLLSFIATLDQSIK
jgi:hypothetical protein